MTEKIPQEPLLDLQRVLPILDQISLFGGLSEDQLHTMFGKLKLVHYKAQDMIFKQGDQPSYIYIVLTGEIRLVFEHADHPLSKAQFLPGACFGETSVIGIQPHSASTLAVVDTDLLVLSKENLMEIFDSDKTLFGMLILNIAREASRRLHKADDLLLQNLRQNDS